MTFAHTPLTAKRVPKHLDLALVDATPLSLAIAATRQMNASHEQCAMRVLTAYHEAAHFVAMVDARDPVISVMVAPNPLSRKSYNGGMVCGLNNRLYENEWFTTLAGSTCEYVLLNPPNQNHLSAALFHDFKQAETECRRWYTHEVEMGRLDGPAEKYVAAVFDGGRAGSRAWDFIHSRWQLICLCATVFLMYGDRNGEVGRPVIDALREAVAERMVKRWPTKHRSDSPVALRNSLPADVLTIWREHSPHIDPEDWAEVA
jgi:hypothetical protein